MEYTREKYLSYIKKSLVLIRDNKAIIVPATIASLICIILLSITYATKGILGFFCAPAISIILANPIISYINIDQNEKKGYIDFSTYVDLAKKYNTTFSQAYLLIYVSVFGWFVFSYFAVSYFMQVTNYALVVILLLSYLQVHTVTWKIPYKITHGDLNSSVRNEIMNKYNSDVSKIKSNIEHVLARILFVGLISVVQLGIIQILFYTVTKPIGFNANNIGINDPYLILLYSILSLLIVLLTALSIALSSIAYYSFGYLKYKEERKAEN